MTENARDAWAGLMAIAGRPGAAAIRPLFAADPSRPARFSHRGGDLLLDLSRTSISDEAMAALLAMARATGVEAFRDAMARGEAVNNTEGRAALHMALRAPRAAGFRAGAEDASASVHDTLDLMRAFAKAVQDGSIRGATGERFTDVLNIGIGGSDLGPAMAARALWNPRSPMRAHYLGNVDGHAWEEVHHRLNPATTLVLVASKTFTTDETMTNAGETRQWLRRALGEDRVGLHLAALSTNLAATREFGVPAQRVFGFRDWVGGRFSLWSSIGLSLALSLGWDVFERLLAGARAMDEHFLAAPLERNLPVLLALVEVWHRNALGYPARAVLPYHERLARLPAHLQQLEMESLGKGVTREGQPVPRATGPVVFGEPGTNAQHSFIQLIHQGTTPVPVDFILVARPDHDLAVAHRKLLANGLAQAEALVRGRDAEEVAAEMRAAGADDGTIARLLPHRVFRGDRPSNVILLPRLDAFTLGQLVALYEHKVAALGAIWDINPFDQWGVELGKTLAGAILPALHDQRVDGMHPATAATVAEIARLRDTEG